MDELRKKQLNTDHISDRKWTRHRGERMRS